MNDDLNLLASRYLDDDLDTDERAHVEHDPELVAEVERLRAVRAALAAVAPPSVERREAAIEAALAAFDGASPRRAVVVPLASRRTPRWLMPAAAAIVGVLALGGLAVVVGTSGDDDSDDSGAVSQEVLRADADELTEGTEAPMAAATTGGDGGGEDMFVADSTAGAATAGTSGATTTAATATMAASNLAVLSSPDDLLDFAVTESTGPAPDAAELRARRRAADCGLGSFVGMADYLTATGDLSPVVIVTDEDEVLAVDPECDVIAHAPHFPDHPGYSSPARSRPALR